MIWLDPTQEYDLNNLTVDRGNGRGWAFSVIIYQWGQKIQDQIEKNFY